MYPSFISAEIPQKMQAGKQAVLQKIDNKFGRIDILVNNAGVAPKVRIDILETTEENFDYVLDINLKGTSFLSQLVARYMIQEVKKCRHLSEDY